jgi:hypothetical protein
LKNVAFVGNKIAGPEDEEFIRDALPGQRFLAMIPYSPVIRNADRDGVSILDAIAGDAGLKTTFEDMMTNIGVM